MQDLVRPKRFSFGATPPFLSLLTAILLQAKKKCALARTVHFSVYFDPIIFYFHNPKPSHLCQTNL
jgi:hypothetical protein